jgi:metal-sulfur cluster biosynthetic enzyme
MSVSESRVRAELEQVLDPCSTFTDNPVNIVDLGLVDEVTVEEGTVGVRLLPTNGMCMYMMHMSEEVTERVGALEGVETVEVTQETGKIWTPVRMSEEARERRQQVFRERAEEHDLTPYYEDGEVANAQTDGDTEAEIDADAD